MPYFSNAFNPQPPASFTLSSFRGINRGLPEEALYSRGGCWTRKGKNFWIDNGVLTVRNNYAALFASAITVGSYTCYVKSAHMFCSKADDATPLWLLGCDMQTGDPLAHHHYALVYGPLDGSTWTECKTAAGSVFGAAKDLYFSNADFSFCNFTGNYEGEYTDDSVAICTNGVDIPVAFLPYAEVAADQGLYEVKSPGWVDIAVDYTQTRMFTQATLANAKYTIEFMSRTGSLPGGIAANTVYYVVNVSGTTFQVSLTNGGAAVTVTSNGSNVMARLRSTDYVAVSINGTTNRVSIAKANWPALKNGYRVMFYTADPDDYPDEIAPDVIYYVRDLSGYTFKITDEPNNKAYDFELSDTSGNLTMCKIVNGWEDCPRGELVFEHDQRLWMKIGNTVYHSDSFYKTQDWEYAHSRDWDVQIPDLRTGSISILTFDGDTIKAVHKYGPDNIVHKENSFWRITGHVPPYGVSCVFSVKGTIAPKSVCQWRGNLIYATADGLEIYNGASAGPLLRDEIRGIWSSDNEDCMCAVVGDTLYVYANLVDPTDSAATAEPGILAVHLPTKNVCYWTLEVDGTTTLDSIDAVVDPVFTTNLSGVTDPLFLFARNGQMYYVETDAPDDGDARDMEYWLPQNTYGDIINRKTFGRMAVYGSGGDIVYTPYVGTTAKTAKTITLPDDPGAAKTKQLSLSNVISAGAKITNSNGNVPRIHSVQTEVTM